MATGNESLHSTDAHQGSIVEETDAPQFDVRASHAALLQEFDNRKESILEKAPERRVFLARVDQLLKQLKELSGHVTTTDDYGWLCQAANCWQLVFTKELGIPRDIRKEVAVATPRLDLAVSPARPNNPSQLITDYLNKEAHSIGLRRKINKILGEFYALQTQPDSIHSLIPSSQDEIEFDWYQANVVLATRVLEDPARLDKQLAPEIYPFLESVWLQDIKRLKAYLNWEREGSRWDPNGAKRRYLTACEWWEKQLLGSREFDSACFEEVSAYLRQRYAIDSDNLNNAKLHELVTAKAYRLWQVSPQNNCDSNLNWHTAEQYVHCFYGNAIRAVVDSCVDSRKKLTALFDMENGGAKVWDLINAFEAMVFQCYVVPSARRRQSSTPRRVAAFQPK